VKFSETTQGLALAGLEVAPAQVHGAIRLLPLLRRQVRGDLRLHARKGAAEISVVGTRGLAAAPEVAYCAYVPHALVMEWDPAGQPIVAHGTALGQRRQLPSRARPVHLVHRMAKREDRNRLRFLPLHLALEGYLSLHFGGPDVIWSEYSREVLARGLSPRLERVHTGAVIEGLADALRVFEIHDDQVGVLIFVADALAAADVVPHPEDYRALHHTLLADLYGELLVHYGVLYDRVGELQPPLRPARVQSLADLRGAVAAQRRSWAEAADLLARGVLHRPLRWQEVHRAGPFRLRRFLGALDLDDENHIGEAIVRDDGALEYLKTFRLSAAQARRAFLLERLAANAWSLAATAESLGTTYADLLLRLRNAGFGYLLRPHILAALDAHRRP